MCTPLAMAGVQVASTLAQGAAEASAQRRQARYVERDARAAAADLSASAEFARDRAARDSASARARLADGLEQARDIRRASRAAVYRSLLGTAGSLAGRAGGGGVITIPI